MFPPSPRKGVRNKTALASYGGLKLHQPWRYAFLNRLTLCCAGSPPLNGDHRQVFLTSLDLLYAALQAIERSRDVRHSPVVTSLEPTVVTLMNKLGDGQARLRDAAMSGLLAVARCPTAGPSLVR